MKIILLTLQFFYLHDILRMHPSICLKLCEKRKFAKKKHASSHLFAGFLCFHLFKFNIRYATAQQKKILPIWIFFLILSCFILFALAIDTAAAGFLVGGPTLKALWIDFGWDFEEDAWTMRGCWWRTMNNYALKYTENVHGPRGRI